MRIWCFSFCLFNFLSLFLSLSLIKFWFISHLNPFSMLRFPSHLSVSAFPLTSVCVSLSEFCIRYPCNYLFFLTDTLVIILNSHIMQGLCYMHVSQVTLPINSFIRLNLGREEVVLLYWWRHDASELKLLVWSVTFEAAFNMLGKYLIHPLSSVKYG